MEVKVTARIKGEGNLYDLSIVASGVQIDDYMKNPVVLDGNNNAIGRADKVYFINNNLYAEMVLLNPKDADLYYNDICEFSITVAAEEKNHNVIVLSKLLSIDLKAKQQ